MADYRVLAIDLGASSGRGIIGSFDGEKLTLRENHRFSNDPVIQNGRMYWDILRIFFEIKQAINKANLDGEQIASIGIDTWGVDYALLDKNGRMLANPVHYRDTRTQKTPEKIAHMASDADIYRATGIQKMNFNTVYQLCEDLEDPTVFARADRMLNIPDLLNYFLTGKMFNEHTVLSTGAILDPFRRDYAEELLAKLQIPRAWFGKPTEPGTTVGNLLPQVIEEVGETDAKVLTVASHDTASAVIAVPAVEKDFVFISSGTWSLMGTELDRPLVNEETERLNFTNEGGALGTVRFLKNIMGLWLIQESRRQWKREGREYSFSEMEAAAKACKPFACLINPDDPSFGVPGDLPGRIREYCKKTGQKVPETMGEVVRCIYESLALKYRKTAESIEHLLGRKNQTIYVVGGGTKDTFLCQMTADACGIPVSAGPVEATAIGNITVQLMAAGKIKTLSDARRIIASSFEQRAYTPTKERGVWDDAYQTFCALTDEK